MKGEKMVIISHDKLKKQLNFLHPIFRQKSSFKYGKLFIVPNWGFLKNITNQKNIYIL